MENVQDSGVDFVEGEWQSFQLSADAVERYWEGIEVALDSAPHLWEHLDTKDYMFTLLTSGMAQCWVVFHGNRHTCTYFTKVNSFPSGTTVVTVWWMVGDLEDSLPTLADTMKHFCLSIGAQYFEVEGRTGWERMLRKYGMVKDRVILRTTVMERMH